MSLATSLAERVLAYRADDVDEPTLRAARAAIADAIGVTLAGSVEECVAIVAGLPGVGEAPGPALLVGGDRRTAILDAALVNGVAAHALDYDDFTQAFGGHPTVPVLPAVVALAEARRASGRDLVAAFVAGVEAENRIAAGVHFHHYEKGWHPTSTLGVFGAAAACAHLMDLDVPRTATALAIAASLSSGVKANFGTMTKPLHVGHCARNGLFAALLAADGFSANDLALEAPQGFLDVFNGAGNYRVEAMLDGWFDPPAVHGISFKQYPCCGSIHPSIVAALRLREAHRIDPAQVRAVKVRTHPLRLPHIDHPDPATALAGKFSLGYCVARALVDGNVALADFEGGAHRDADVRRIMAVFDAGVHAEMAGQHERTFGAEVTITLAGGETLCETVEHEPGRGPDRPMDAAEQRAKLADCAGRVLDAAAVEALWRQLQEIERLPDVRRLTGAMAVPARAVS